MRLWRLLSTLRLRLRSIVRRARVEQELDDEIRDHIDRRVAADVARGVAPEQARQAALRAFGGIEQAKEACRDVRGVNVIEHTVQDVRFAARRFARAPSGSSTRRSATTSTGAWRRMSPAAWGASRRARRRCAPSAASSRRRRRAGRCSA